MVRRGSRGGSRRNRRTRQEILLQSQVPWEAEGTTVSPVVPDGVDLEKLYDLDKLSRKKKSLRLLFQEAKSGKIGDKKKKKKLTFNWPRTVEAAKSPFADRTGKNKWFFLLSIGLYPTNKIIQPSESESEVEDDEDKPENEEGSRRKDDKELGAGKQTSHQRIMTSIKKEVDSCEDEEDPPSPGSPKPRRGRRPGNGRRGGGRGRGGRRDQTWRAGGNPPRRGRKKNRQRVDNAELIQDVIETVIRNYRRKYEDNLVCGEEELNNNSVPAALVPEVCCSAGNSNSTEVTEVKGQEPSTDPTLSVDNGDIDVMAINHAVLSESSDEGEDVDVECRDDKDMNVWRNPAENGIDENSDDEDASFQVEEEEEEEDDDDDDEEEEEEEAMEVIVL